MTRNAHRLRLACLTLILVCGGIFSAAFAGDWPQFRGPNRDGVWNERNVGRGLEKGRLAVLWRRPVGRGKASPVIAEGRVFVTDSELKTPKAWERTLCFDATDGRPKWEFNYEVEYPDWAFNPEHSGGPAATPVVEAGRVYTVGGNGRVHCLNAETGEPVWSFDPGKEYTIRTLQCRPSPLIEGRLLIACLGARPGACVMAFDKNTGKKSGRLWMSPFPTVHPS